MNARPPRFLVPLLVAAVAAVGQPALAGHDSAAYDRAYLLADTGDFLWWSFDPAEEGANLRLVERRCPELVWGPGAKPCLVGSSGLDTRTFSLWFDQRARVDEAVTWSATNPLRFRLALVVDPPVPVPVVRLAYADGSTHVQSAPATEVAPSVWEGTLTEGAPIEPGERGQLGVRLSYTGAAAAVVRLRTDGSSWIAFPEPVRGRSLGDLKRLSPDAPQAQTVRTFRKAFRFNDGEWELRSFTGDLAQTRSFTHTLSRRAAAVFGWTETGRGPMVQRVVRDRKPETAHAGPYSQTHLLQDGEILDHGVGFDDMGDTATALDVAAGQVELRVDSSGGAGAPDPYEAHLLVVYGQRTLQGLRTRFTVSSVASRAPITASCPGVREPLPITPAVSAFRIEIDWDGVLPNQRWVPRYGLPEGDYPCGESGTGDSVSFVNVPEGTFWFGATTSKDTLMASYRDTVLDADVRFWHDPPPHP
ncbi:MAG: hypothetical protein M3245_02040 [Actinomycetota bacterium]|nr:hypothetical protein [Actinomycetota bacterium]